MVKRLKDGESLETLDLQLTDLFRAAAPFEVDPFQKRRILVRLERKSVPSTRPFWVRPAIIATLLVSGTATAALGHRYVTQGSPFLSPTTTTTTVPDAKQVRRAPPPRHVVSGVALAPVPDSAEAAPPALAVPELSEPAASPSRPVVKSSQRVRPDSIEDASHVVEAIQALRTGRDPARAQGLLNDYLKTHPHGVLSGDALALSIEAASAQHDPRAADYARRYLASFPKGKYRELAKRALDHR